jgi:hypothetical protein
MVSATRVKDPIAGEIIDVQKLCVTDSANDRTRCASQATNRRPTQFRRRRRPRDLDLDILELLRLQF